MVFQIIEQKEYCCAPDCHHDADPDIKGDLGEGYCCFECLEYTDDLCDEGF